jgi:ferredoxin-NADP reductase
MPQDQEMDLLVRSVRLAAADVILIELADPEGEDLPGWDPGSHLELVLPSGRIRHYSLCGPAAGHSSYEVAVLRAADGRGGSAELHDTGLVGKLLRVRGPRNRFHLDADAPAYLLVAGGIGVTPLLPMARQLASSRLPFRVIYGARSAQAMAFAGELRALVGEDLELVDEQIAGRLDLGRIVDDAPDGALVYCCGR